MPVTLRVLVCGDREWSDKDAIRRELSALPAGTVIIHGACRGADNLAGEVADELGLPQMPFPVDWEQARRELGSRWRAAGPMRNQKMLKEGRPHRALIFHADLTRSKGTRDMVERLLSAGVSCKQIRGTHNHSELRTDEDSCSHSRSDALSGEHAPRGMAADDCR